MSDRPILFSAPMVRALLAGTKTQTRRVLKPQPELYSEGRWHVFGPGGGIAGVHTGDVPEAALDFVRIDAGDRLWVREAWKAHSTFEGVPPRDIPPTKVFYLADDGYSPSGSRGRPGMFMPRWASRLTLAVTDVRVELLQDISEADARAEGVFVPEAQYAQQGHRAPVLAYAGIWEDINGPRSWEANPWVMAVSFAVQKGNIDAL